MHEENVDENVDNIPTKQNLNWIQSITYPIRDVLLSSLEKGQFIIASLLLLIGMFIWRLPSNELSKVFDSLFSRIENNWLWGWILFVICIFSWYVHYRFNTKTFIKEINRINKEKDSYQRRLFQQLNKKK